MILAVVKTIYGFAYIEACKKSGLQRGLNLAIPGRWSNQLSYEATDFGSWSCKGPKEPVRNEFEVIVKYFKY